MAAITGDVNLPKEHYSDFSCDDIRTFLEDVIRSVFKTRKIELEWTAEVDTGKRTWTLFMKEIGTEVVEYCNRYSEECRKNEIFNLDITDVIAERFKPGYFNNSTSDLAYDLLQKTEEQETVNSTYYCLALIAELCFQLAVSGRQNLIPSVIQGAERALHHRTDLQFQRRYWHIARHAVNRHNPRKLQELTVDSFKLLR